MTSTVRGLSVPWHWRQAVFVYLTAWIGLPLLLIAFFTLLSPWLPQAADFMRGLRAGEIEAAFYFLLLDSLAALLLVRYFLRKYHAGWREVGLRDFNLVRGGLYVLVVFLAFLAILAGLFSLLSHLFPAFDPSEPQINEFTRSAAAAPRLSLLALVVIPSVIEEIVFRGFIFPAFLSRFGLAVGVFGSSALFALAHLQLNVVVYTFVLGCLLCMMYVKLKSIWPGIFLHLLNNYLAFTALLG